MVAKTKVKVGKRARRKVPQAVAAPAALRETSLVQSVRIASKPICYLDIPNYRTVYRIDITVEPRHLERVRFTNGMNMQTLDVPGGVLVNGAPHGQPPLTNIPIPDYCIDTTRDGNARYQFDLIGPYPLYFDVILYSRIYT